MIIAIDAHDGKRHNRFSWKCTSHSLWRAAQRGLTMKDLLKVMEYGEAVFKQGLTFYTVTKRSFPAYAPVHDLDHLNNWVVVEDGHGVVLTCYHSSNGLKHLKLKQRELAR